jgi:molybdenum-dependent DNA-binding transcriptional regulator ModE
MSIANKTAELDSIGEALLQLVRARSKAQERLAFARFTLAQAEREAADADASVLRAEQQQRLALVQAESAP